MTISERKEEYAKQFEQIANKVRQLTEELQKANTALEQTRGAYMAIEEMEKDQAVSK